MMFHMAPTTFHGMSSGNAISTRQTETHGPLRGMVSAIDEAKRNLDQQDERGEDDLAQPRARWNRSECSTCSNQVNAGPEEDIVAEGFLDREIDDRHQRDERVEGNHQEDRQDETTRPC